MLKDFFKLNGEPVQLAGQLELLEHFRTSSELRNVAYTARQIAPEGAEARFSDRSFINCAFKRTIVRGVVFTRCKFEDCLFLGTQFVKCEFHECTFVGCNPHHSSFENTYIDPRTFEGSFDPKKHANIGVRLFQALMQNAELTRQRQFAAAAEFNFLKWKRYQLNYERRTRKIGRWRYLRSWAPNAAYYAIAGYGLRARFFAFWLTAAIMLVWWANFYCWPLLGIVGREGPKPAATPIEALYFSVVTLTTLGYGDLTPTSAFGMIAVTFQAMCGVVLLGTFAAILIRKVVR